MTRARDQDEEQPEPREMAMEPASSNQLNTQDGAQQIVEMAEDEKVDLNTILEEIMKRREDQNIVTKKSGVVFRNINVQGVNSLAKFQRTLWDALIFPVRLVNKLHGIREKPVIDILQSFNGVVKEGEMLLLIGRPKSGSSTLLKVLSGQTKEYHKVEGEVHYNGIPSYVIRERFRGDVIYNEEIDQHYPFLKVKETIEFAAKLRTPATRIGTMSRNSYIRALRMQLAKVFGLSHVQDTRVGNDFIRGVSGGERKRVSIAEVFASRAMMMCFDNSTRGLDASTALEYAKSLRVISDLTKASSVVSLYQAGEGIYKLFDKVTVLYSGRQIFFGHINDGRDYFYRMGFKLENRITTPDFLAQVTDPKARIIREGYEEKVPKTAEDFVYIWLNSPEYQKMLKEMADYEEQYPVGDIGPDSAVIKHQLATAQAKSKHSSPLTHYTCGYREQVAACTIRAWQLIKGNYSFVLAQIIGAITQGLVFGSAYYNQPLVTQTLNSRASLIFFGIFFNAIVGMADVALQFEQRPILARQKAFALSRPSAQALGSLLVDFPVRLIYITCFEVAIYFLGHLQRTARKFFIFYLFAVFSSFTIFLFFRFLASLTRSFSQALVLSGIGLLILSIYTGFFVRTNLIGKWFRWITYLNPLYFAFEAAVLNEFHNIEAACSILVPNGPGYANVALANQVCATSGSGPGENTILGDQYLRNNYQYYHAHLWRDFGILIGFLSFFLIGHVWAIDYLVHPIVKKTVLVFRRGHLPESLKDESKNTTNDEEKVANQQIKEEPMERNDFKSSKFESKDLFTFENMNYTIKTFHGERKLLQDVNGYVEPGTITALMGESGAGKTTLLNALAKRLQTGVVTGDLLVNGKNLNLSFQRSTGYVQQQDVHIAECTVREALIFSALLRRPRSVSKKEKLDYVDDILRMLEMEEFSDAVVGVPGTGLSVEQRKRLSIGIELASKPTLLLFLDEPSSGLDSQSAWSIIAFLRKLARSGQAIVCTIHQPSSILFQQFDRLLLLKKGGQTVYFGDIGHDSRTLLDYFEKNGAPKCKDDENPAEYILDAIGAGATAKASQDWFEVWNKSEEKQTELQKLSDLKEKYSKKNLKKRQQSNSKINSSYATPFYYQLGYCLKRQFQVYWRKPDYILSKFLLNAIAGVFVGFTFYKTKTTLQGLQFRVFAIFISLVLSSPNINQLQPVFIGFRQIFEVREGLSKIYSWIVFVLTQLIVEIPFDLVASALFFLPWYFEVGFYRNQTNINFIGGVMYLFYFLFTLYYITLGQTIASISPNAETAGVINGIIISFLLMFSGVIQPKENLESFWLFAYRLTPITYLVGGMSALALHNLPVKCADNEFNPLIPPVGQTCGGYLAEYFANGFAGYLENPDDDNLCRYCMYRVGDEFLDTVSIKYDQLWRNFCIIIGYLVFNFFALFFAFWLARVIGLNRLIHAPINFTRQLRKRIMRRRQ